MRSSTCRDSRRQTRPATNSDLSSTQCPTRRPNLGEHHPNRNYHGHQRHLCRSRHPRTLPRAAYRPPRPRSPHLHPSLLNQRGRVICREDPAHSTHSPLRRCQAPKTAHVRDRTLIPGFRNQRSREKTPSGPSEIRRRKPRGENRLHSRRCVRKIGIVGAARLSSRRGHIIAERAVRAS